MKIKQKNERSQLDLDPSVDQRLDLVFIFQSVDREAIQLFFFLVRSCEAKHQSSWSQVCKI